MTKRVRTRFAPSPTGFMHIGNLRTALYAYLFAKSNNGDFILRIEDTDLERKVDGAVDAIYRTLATSGIVIDEGPLQHGNYGPYVQSQRKDIYLEYAKKLVEIGGAYYCFCDKDRLESLTDDKGNRKYDKHCLNLSAEQIAERLNNNDSYVIRQNIPLSGKTSYIDMVFGEIVIDCADLEDNVLLKSDGMPTYNFANVVDDHLMEISHVIRGTEYLSSTPKYNLIYQSFGWEIPKYMHLSPIMRDAQHKLSKRYGDANFEDFIAKGFLPQAIINYIALLGWSPKNNVEKLSLDELIQLFSVDGLTKSGSIFDENKMRWLNAQYIKELSFDEFCSLAQPFYQQSVIADLYDYDKFSKILASRIDTFSDILEKVKFITEFNEYDTELFIHKKMKTTLDIAKLSIASAIDVLNDIPTFDIDTIAQAWEQKSQDLEIKKGQMLWCIRIALTGHAVTPGGAIEIADILGKQQCLQRLSFSLNLLNN